jgi:hypothetical protein
MSFLNNFAHIPDCAAQSTSGISRLAGLQPIAGFSPTSGRG